MDYFHLSEDQQDLLKMSNLGLAYLGDAVYEVMVRAWLCLHGRLTPGRLHRAALDYVAAPRQAALAQGLLPLLTEEEVELLTSPLELATYKDAIMEAMFRGTKRNIESEADPKNVPVG